MCKRITEGEIKKYKTDFVNASCKIKPIIEGEDGITLTFFNYADTLLSYIKCSDTDIASLEKLMRDCNLWSVYLGQLKALVESSYFRRMNKRDYIKAFPNTIKNDKEIQKLNKQISELKLYIKHLGIQKKMFTQMSDSCSNMYSKACEQLLYRY